MSMLPKLRIKLVEQRILKDKETRGIRAAKNTRKTSENNREGVGASLSSSKAQ